MDNHSSDDSFRQISQAFPDLHFHACPENLGFAGGNNVAIRQIPKGKSDFILLLNNDALVSEEAVQVMLDLLDEHDHLDVVGPLINEVCDKRMKQYCGGRDMGRFVHTRIPYLPAEDTGEFTCVDYVSGTVFLARAKIFETHGLLDEAFFFSGEIADFCKRIQKNNARCAISLRAEALHETDDSPLRETLYLYYTLRNRFLFIRKHNARQYRRFALFWTLCGMAMFVMAVLKGRFPRCQAIRWALADGWAGKFGNKNDRFIS